MAFYCTWTDGVLWPQFMTLSNGQQNIQTNCVNAGGQWVEYSLVTVGSASGGFDVSTLDPIVLVQAFAAGFILVVPVMASIWGIVQVIRTLGWRYG